MSVNVYLETSILRNKSLVTTQTGGVQKMELYGVSIYSNQGRPYVVLGNENDPVPQGILAWVSLISFYDIFPRRADRVTGIYALRSAEGELDIDQTGKYSVKITGKKMDDVRDLYRAIRTGSLQPEKSYEGPQGGKTNQQLEAELAKSEKNLNDALEGLKEIRRLQNLNLELENLLRGTRIAIQQVRDLAHRLKKDFWSPLCFKDEVAAKIVDALDNRIMPSNTGK